MNSTCYSVTYFCALFFIPQQVPNCQNIADRTGEDETLNHENGTGSSLFMNTEQPIHPTYGSIPSQGSPKPTSSPKTGRQTDLKPPMSTDGDVQVGIRHHTRLSFSGCVSRYSCVPFCDINLLPAPQAKSRNDQWIDRSGMCHHSTLLHQTPP